MLFLIDKEMVEEKNETSDQKKVVYFTCSNNCLRLFLLIVVGTILLMMPFSAQAGQKRNGLMLFRGNFRRLCYRAFAFEYGGTLESYRASYYYDFD